MNQSMMANVDKYLELFQEIRQKVGDDIVARTVMQEVAKDRRMDEIREERELRNGEPATTRQVQYLKRLGVELAPGLTKKQASLLIDNALAEEE
jgi:hypothetical protein